MDDVQCTGSETSIADCQHKGWARHNCRHTEDVSISCTDAQSQPHSNNGTRNYYAVVPIGRYNTFHNAPDSFTT